MKKILFGLISIIFAVQVSFAQPVSDMAVIPMGITVQSVMRLNVTSGGNVEFVFSNINDIQNGIAFGTSYETNFDLAASQPWDLEMNPDAGTFDSESGGSIALNVVEYYMEATILPAISSTNTTNNAGTLAAPVVLATAVATADALESTANNVGTATCVIHWRCGVTNSVSGASAGRYTANIYLSLKPAD